jgi:hypothetical protein
VDGKKVFNGFAAMPIPFVIQVDPGNGVCIGEPKIFILGWY